MRLGEGGQEPRPKMEGSVEGILGTDLHRRGRRTGGDLAVRMGFGLMAFQPADILFRHFGALQVGHDGIKQLCCGGGFGEGSIFSAKCVSQKFHVRAHCFILGVGSPYQRSDGRGRTDGR